MTAKASSTTAGQHGGAGPRDTLHGGASGGAPAGAPSTAPGGGPRTGRRPAPAAPRIRTARTARAVRGDRTPNATPAPSPLRQWIGLAVLMLPVLLVSIDTTVLNFALPDISESLRPSGVQLLWIVDVYPMVMAGLLVAMGSFADRIGRRKLLIAGSSGFALVSALAAFAPGAGWLILARAALGLFGATLMPSTMSLLRSLFTDRRRRRLAIAIWGSGYAGGAALGPLVGGALLEHFWWGSVFLLAVPMLVPMLILLPILVPESRDPAPGPVDVPSVVLSLAALAPFVFGIKTLATHGVSTLAILAVLVGVLSGWAFVRRQLRRPVPMFDMRLFRHPAFSGSVVINMLSLMAYTGALFFAAQQLQLVMGMSPMRAGVVLLPGMAATIVSGLVVVPIARRVRPGRVIAGGMAAAALGYAVMSVASGSAIGGMMMAAFVAVGVGIGFAETVTNELIVSTAPAHKTGAAAAVSETAYEIGAVLGTAVLGTMVTVAYRLALTLPAGLSHAQHAAATQTIGGAASVADALPGALGDRVMSAAAAAFQSGIGVTAAVTAALAALGAVLALLALRRVPVGDATATLSTVEPPEERMPEPRVAPAVEAASTATAPIAVMAAGAAIGGERGRAGARRVGE